MSKTIKLVKTAFKPKKVPKQIKKYVKKEIDRAIQDKTVSYVYQNNVGTAGIILPVGFLTKGDDQWERIGSAIRPKYLTIRGAIAGEETFAIVRVICGYFKAVNGVLPAVTTVLRHSSSAGAGNTSVYSPYNQVANDQFVIYSDKSYTLSGFNVAQNNAGTETSYVNPKVVLINKRIKMKRRIQYTTTGNAGDITDVTSGLPFVLIISDNNTNLPAYDMNLSLTYEDA